MRDQELIGLYEAYQQVHKLQEEETGAGPRLMDPYDGKRYDGQGGPKGGGTIRGPKKRKNILKVSKELMNSYDNWVGQLISDGYDLSNWTDEGLFEYYEQLCEESLEKGQSPTPGGMIKPTITPAIPPKPPKGTKVNTGYKESYGESNVLGNVIDAGAGAVKKPIENFANRKVGGIAGALGIPGRIAGQKVDQTAQQLKDKDFGGALKTVTGGVRSLMQSYDLYDTILEYLITEGYADTNENALVIMANMSEEWKESIVEAKKTTDDDLADGDLYSAMFRRNKKTKGSKPPDSTANKYLSMKNSKERQQNYNDDIGRDRTPSR